MTVDVTPKYSTVSELFQDIFKDKCLNHSTVSNLLLTGNTTLLIEVICILLDRYYDSKAHEEIIGGHYSEERILNNLLSINKGYSHPSAEFDGLFYQLVTTPWYDVIDLFRILRSRTDWTSETFRTAIANSEYRQYKTEFINTYVHISPAHYRYFFMAKIFELTFRHEEQEDGTTKGDYLFYWIQPVATLGPDGAYHWRFDTFGRYNDAKAQELMTFFFTELCTACFYSGNFAPLQILIEQEYNVDYTAPVKAKPTYPTSIKLLKNQIKDKNTKFNLAPFLQKIIFSQRFLLSYLQAIDNREQAKHYKDLLEVERLETVAKILDLDEKLSQKRQNMQQLLEVASQQNITDKENWNKYVTELESVLKQQDDLFEANKDILQDIIAYRVSNITQDTKTTQDSTNDVIIATEEESTTSVNNSQQRVERVAKELSLLQTQINDYESKLSHISDTEGFLIDNYEILRKDIKDIVVLIDQILLSSKEKINYYYALNRSHSLVAELYYEFTRTFLDVFHLDCCFSQDLLTLQVAGVITNDLSLCLMLAVEGLSFKQRDVSEASIKQFLIEQQEKTEKVKFLSLDDVDLKFKHSEHHKPLITNNSYTSSVTGAIRTYGHEQNIDFVVSQLLTYNLTTIIDQLIKYINKHHILTPKPPAAAVAKPSADEKEKKKTTGGKKGGNKKQLAMQKMAEVANQQKLSAVESLPDLDASTLFGDDQSDFVVAEASTVAAAVTSDAVVPVSTRKLVNLNDICLDRNYIATVCNAISTRVSTLRYLIQKKSKLFTNSKVDAKNNAFLSCLSNADACPQSRDEMLIFLFEHIDGGKFMPLLTQQEAFQCISLHWELMHRPIGTQSIPFEQLPSKQINKHNLFYIDRSELFFHLKRLIPAVDNDPMAKMMGGPQFYFDNLTKILQIGLVPTLYDISVLNEQNAGKQIPSTHPLATNGYFGYYDTWDLAQRDFVAKDTILAELGTESTINNTTVFKENSWLYGYYRDMCSLFTGVLFSDPSKQAALSKPNQACEAFFVFAAAMRCQPLLRWFIQYGFRPTRRTISSICTSHAFGTLLQDANFDEFVRQNISYESLVAGFNVAAEWKVNTPAEQQKIAEESVDEVIQSTSDAIELIASADDTVDNVDDDIKKDNEELPQIDDKSTKVEKPVDVFDEIFGTEEENKPEEKEEEVKDEAAEEEDKPEAEKQKKSSTKKTAEKKSAKKSNNGFASMFGVPSAGGANNKQKAADLTPDLSLLDAILPVFPTVATNEDLESLTTPFSLSQHSSFYKTLCKSDDYIYTRQLPVNNEPAGIVIGWHGHRQTVKFLFTTDCDYYFKSGHIDAAQAIMDYCATVTREDAELNHPDILELIDKIQGTAERIQIPGAIPYDTKYLFINPEAETKKKDDGKVGKIVEDTDELETIFLAEYFRLLHAYTAYFRTKHSPLFSPSIYCLLTVIDACPNDFDKLIVDDFSSHAILGCNITLTHGLFISRPDPLRQVETARTASIMVFMLSEIFTYYASRSIDVIVDNFFYHFRGGENSLEYQALSVLTRNLSTDALQAPPLRHLHWVIAYLKHLGSFSPTALPLILRLLEKSVADGNVVEFLDAIKLYRQMNDNIELFNTTHEYIDKETNKTVEVDISTANQPMCWITFMVSLPRQQIEYLEGLYNEKQQEAERRAKTVTSEKKMMELQQEFTPIMQGLQQALQETAAKIWEPRHLRKISALLNIDNIEEYPEQFFEPWKVSDIPHYKDIDEKKKEESQARIDSISKKPEQKRKAAPTAGMFPGMGGPGPQGPAPPQPIVPDADLLMKSVTAKATKSTTWLGRVFNVSNAVVATGVVAAATAAAYAWGIWGSTRTENDAEAGDSEGGSESTESNEFSMFGV